ncbi:MAG: hypothetical protein CME64_17345 [Halobacteriovoraceae bacterium]|nr:hypothetical protein [Halobacteriovoraceae bacterium]
MKILHICQFLGIGGLEKVLLTLCQEQIEHGNEVSLFVYDKDQRWVEKYMNAGVNVINNYQKCEGYDFRLLNKIKEVSLNYDIIHTHDLNPALYLAPLSFIPGAKLSFIHTTHGMEHLKTRPKTRLYEAVVGMCASKIVSVSTDFGNYYLKQPLTKNRKVRLINNGVEQTLLPERSPKKLYCEEFNLNPKLPLAAYVARVGPMKDQKRLIDIYNNSEHQLLIIGPSSDLSYYAACKRSSKKNIVLTGARNDIRNILGGLDYYISSSKHEGLPISVLEAGASNTPCLLSQIPGHEIFNIEKECVMLFKEDENPLDRYSDLLKKKNVLVKNFKDEITEKYSSKTMFKRYHSVYKELLAEKC